MGTVFVLKSSTDAVNTELSVVICGFFPLRHGGAAHFNSRAARLFQRGGMSRGGKAVERIAPFEIEVTIPVLGHTVLVDANLADRRQHAPCVIGRCAVLFELDKLMVDRCLCLNKAKGGQQRIFHLDGICAAVRRLVTNSAFYRLSHHALCLFLALVVGDEGAARRLPYQYTVSSSDFAAGTTVR